MRAALEGLPGVAEVSVDFESRTAHVELRSGSEVPGDVLVKALEDAGFPGSSELGRHGGH
ncbi:MAG: heavy-metal-associated domain-containing protein [Planctomycetales bacterium]|nr:heavy-metal-associated domain-containing protein [Planctomycetales bacterium]